MRRLVLAVAMVFGFAAAAAAQTPPAPVTPSAKFTWTQNADQATAQGYRYELELDGAPQTTPLTHTCTTATGGAVCTAPVPAMTAATHTARIRTVDTAFPDTANWLYSDYSDPVTFTMRLAPGRPGGVNIIQVKPGE